MNDYRVKVTVQRTDDIYLLVKGNSEAHAVEVAGNAADDLITDAFMNGKPLDANRSKWGRVADRSEHEWFFEVDPTDVEQLL